jgi:peptidoglycan/LPS O-acetylase OafA/YrhL
MKKLESIPKPTLRVRSHKRQDIQVLRATAVIGVILFHVGLPVPGGFSGVDVFFVISGFVITSMLLREVRETGRISLRNFYARRVRRLVPAVAIMVAVVAVLVVLVYPTFETVEPGIATGLGGLFFVGNIVIDRLSWDYFAPASAWNPFLHLWSLGVEEQFYIVFPLLLMAGIAIWKLPRWRPLVAAFFVFALVSFGISWFGSSDFRILLPWGQSFLGFYSPLSRMWEFLLGALIALLPVIFLSLRASKWLVFAGSLGILASFLLLDSSAEDRTIPLLLPTVSAALIIFAVTMSPPKAESVRPAIRFLVLVGDLSYSLYLWHWPFIVLFAYVWPNSPLSGPSSLLFSVPLAALSYYIIENPVRSGRRVVALSPLKFSAASVGLAFFALLCATFILQNVTGPWMKGGDSAATPSAHGDLDLLSPTEACDDYEKCQQGDPTRDPEVLILGASHAADLFLGVRAGLPEYSVARISDSRDAYSDASSALHRDILADENVKIIIIGHYLGHPTRTLDWPSVREAVESFSDGGKTVLINDDWPVIRIDPARCRYGLPFAPQAKVCAVSSEESDENRARYLPEIEVLRRDFPRVGIIDSYSLFCESGTCLVGDGEEVWFRDNNHITPEGSLKIGRALDEIIRM